VGRHRVEETAHRPVGGVMAPRAPRRAAPPAGGEQDQRAHGAGETEGEAEPHPVRPGQTRMEDTGTEAGGSVSAPTHTSTSASVALARGKTTSSSSSSGRWRV